MKIKKLLLCNIFSFIWLLVQGLCALCVLLGASYDTASSWQFLGFLIVYYASRYVNWPTGLFFVTSEGNFLLDSPWRGILSLIISLGTCIAVDFLLRKFLWNKIQKTKAIGTE